jgi:hypothetical protein
VVEVIVALTGLRLDVLDAAGYTVIVLVAVVTSLMAPPTLRFAMARVELGEEEWLRRIDHNTWQGHGPAVEPAATAVADGPSTGVVALLARAPVVVALVAAAAVTAALRLVL